MSLRAGSATPPATAPSAGIWRPITSSPPTHDGEKVVEVVRDAAGELADGFHLLRLPKRLLRLLARFVLGFKLPRALPDRLLQGLGEGAQLHQRPLAFRHVDVDADDPNGTPLAS